MGLIGACCTIFVKNREISKRICKTGRTDKRGKTGMLREGYDPPISRSLEAKTRECTSEPYESGALTS